MHNDNYIRESINFGTNLKFLRNRNGLSLAALSKELMIPRGTLGYYECGYSKPSAERGNKFAEFYNLETVEDLFMNPSDFEKKYGV